MSNWIFVSQGLLTTYLLTSRSTPCLQIYEKHSDCTVFTTHVVELGNPAQQLSCTSCVAVVMKADRFNLNCVPFLLSACCYSCQPQHILSDSSSRTVFTDLHTLFWSNTLCWSRCHQFVIRLTHNRGCACAYCLEKLVAIHTSLSLSLSQDKSTNCASK